MPTVSRLKWFYWAYLSKPAADRPLYRLVRKRPIRRIVEVGMGTGERARRLIQIAQTREPQARISYAGIDSFELRPVGDGDAFSLKFAFRTLRATGARVRLLPGDVFTTLARAANDLTGTDLVIISVGQQPGDLARAWFYVPRMLHADSLVYVERTLEDGSSKLELLSRARIAELASYGRRRAA